MDTRHIWFIRLIIFCILVLSVSFFAFMNKTIWIEDMNADDYFVGETIIKNPVIVLFPSSQANFLTRNEEIGCEFVDTIIDVRRFVCSDSIAQFIAEPGWCQRPDVYLYIDELSDGFSIGKEPFRRLPEVINNIDINELLGKANDTCIYRNVFPADRFEVYMVATRHLLFFRSDDEVFEHPVVDSYRLAVKYHYTDRQLQSMGEKILQYEQYYDEYMSAE